MGVGFPGVIRNGIVEESPNLQQIKGFPFAAALCGVLARGGLKASVLILNDADAIAAGVAATRGHLEKLIRIWYLGDGVGFGRYPQVEGVWEGGHMVVSLDPKEHYCGCGGAGHLEGIMGHRAMRLRFLDMEPEEVFAAAREGDVRCSTFVKRWHRALAAASASSIHLDGPGKFFIMGPNSQYVDLGLVGAVHSRDGQDDAAARELVRDHFEQPRSGDHRGRGERAAGGGGLRAVRQFAALAPLFDAANLAHGETPTETSGDASQVFSCASR